ncbi:hypothetical protein HA402_007223 [Bradysia odoriphaga]|nr:hypothetical protein HA402_007223 [Bradysia odoriphaga]
MKTLPFFIVAILITCVTTTSDESSSSEENDGSFSSSDESASSSSSVESTECKLNYQYTIWIGDNVEEIHSINLNSECGIVFLNAMQQASQKREQFRFEYSTHPLFGTLVTKIDSLPNDDETNTFWMLYDLTTEPDVANAPDDTFLSSMVVSSLKVKDNHSYLFWYRTSNAAVPVEQSADLSDYDD